MKNRSVHSRLILALGGFGIPTWIIAVFWIIVLIAANRVGISVQTLLSDTIKRVGMNSVLVLAMVPAIQSGTGPNFALPIGIVCGLFALVCAIELNLLGAMWLLVSLLLSVIFAVIAGYFYGKLLNAVKGSEMTIATYTGFSIVALMSLVWLVVPFTNPKMGWFIGDGLRETIQLDAVEGNQILNNFLAFNVGGEVVIPTTDVDGKIMVYTIIDGKTTSVDIKEVAIPDVKAGGIIPSFNIGEIKIPAVIGGKGIRYVETKGTELSAVREGVTILTGLILFFAFLALAVWLFFRSKAGIAISAGGINPKFAQAAGLDIDRNRIRANVLSTVLGAIGIIVYSQSYGYAQLYAAPLMMAFPAVAAILIGGATASRAKISHVVIGVILFQGLLTTALPVTNELFKGTDLSEIARMIIQNGVILYALTQVKRGG